MKMINVKPGVYALGLVEGYLGALATSGDANAQQMIEAVNVADRLLREAGQEAIRLQLIIDQIRVALV